MSKFENYCIHLEEAEHPLTESQKRLLSLKGVEDRDYLETKDICATKTFMETIHQLRKKSIQLDKYVQTRSEKYCRANQTRSNGGGPRNRNNHNTGNDKEKKYSATYIMFYPLDAGIFH